jgi:hypothetical protein
VLWLLLACVPLLSLLLLLLLLLLLPLLLHAELQQPLLEVAARRVPPRAGRRQAGCPVCTPVPAWDAVSSRLPRVPARCPRLRRTRRCASLRPGRLRLSSRTGRPCKQGHGSWCCPLRLSSGCRRLGAQLLARLAQELMAALVCRTEGPGHDERHLFLAWCRQRLPQDASQAGGIGRFAAWRLLLLLLLLLALVLVLPHLLLLPLLALHPACLLLLLEWLQHRPRCPGLPRGADTSDVPP